MALYTLLHPEAKLSAPDRKALCKWADAARRNLTTDNPTALGQ